MREMLSINHSVHLTCFGIIEWIEGKMAMGEHL